MKIQVVVILSIVTLLSISFVASSEHEGAYLLREPFYWGVATAAYQIEGAVSEDGRGPSIWDSFSSIPGKIHNNDNGDIADDSYHQFLKDIELLKALGVNSYRFSIAWPRILPQGTGIANPAGIAHYQRVLDALEEANIEPFVTLYHWDLPQALEDRYKGLQNRQFIDDFKHYADICFAAFGNRVKHWITINEPWTIAYLPYGPGIMAPGRCSDRNHCAEGDSATESYLAAHHLLLAHAAAVTLYRTKYQPVQHGLIGITLNLDWAVPYRAESAEDSEAAERRREFTFAWFADPLFFGHYPASMRTLVGARLPEFTPAEIQQVQHSLDFLGVNHYSTKYLAARYPGGPDQNPHLSPHLFPNLTQTLADLDQPSWIGDQHTIETNLDPQGQLIGPQAASPWLNTVPQGFEDMLHWVHRRYDLYFDPNNLTLSDGSVRPIPPWVYVTENGCDAPNESQRLREEALHDSFRINYLQGYLSALDRAIQRGARVKGYFAWSLLDNFEWADGYDKRFGLYYVDYTDPARTRYAKDSAAWYRNYIDTHQTSYEGTQRVIVPIHAPGRSPDKDSDDVAVYGSGTLGDHTVIDRVLARLSQCKSFQDTAMENEEEAAGPCQWWERIVASYFAHAALHARW